jgi:single-stranded DNA-binding protein
VSIGVGKSRQTETGEWVKDTTWYSVELHADRFARTLETLTKGDYVICRGRLDQRTAPNGKTYNNIRPDTFDVVPRKKADAPAQVDAEGNPF